MLPLIYTDPLYTSLMFATFLGWAASELIGPVRWSQRRQGEKRDQGTLWWSAFPGLSGVVLAFVLPLFLRVSHIPGQPGSFFLGMGVVLTGIIWRWYAIATLGRYFTAAIMIQEKQPVIQHGPYRFIRHPSYTGVLLIVAGMGVMIGNWISVCLMTLGLLIGLLHRIAIEEQELRRSLEPYEEYMQRTKRLIPFLY